MRPADTLRRAAELLLPSRDGGVSIDAAPLAEWLEIDEADVAGMRVDAVDYWLSVVFARAIVEKVGGWANEAPQTLPDDNGLGNFLEGE